MSWTKLDDGLYDHPKVLAAGNEATGLFCRALSYCGKQLTDGFVPASVASFLGREKAVEALVDAGLWERVDGGFNVHDYLDYNRPRADVLADRAKSTERQRRWRESRRSSRRDNTGDNGVTGTVNNGRPDPTRPDPKSPPVVPRERGTASLPARPSGNRQRDHRRYREAIGAFAAAHLPGVDSRRAVEALDQAIEHGGCHDRDSALDFLQDHFPELAVGQKGAAT
jgi:hypothetical protein